MLKRLAPAQVLSVWIFHPFQHNAFVTFTEKVLQVMQPRSPILRSRFAGAKAGIGDMMRTGTPGRPSAAYNGRRLE